MKNLPFVVFSEPYSEILNVKLQNDDKLHLNFDLNCGAFVFAPFDSDKFDKIYLPFEKCKSFTSVYSNKVIRPEFSRIH